MIIHFGSDVTRDIYHGRRSKKTRKFPEDVVRIAERKLDLIHAAKQLQDLRVPPGNQLKFLKGDKKGFLSIRVNDQYRIIFRFKEGNASHVELIDYH